MAGEILLVAIGCGRLPGIIDKISRHAIVVFATMDKEVLAGLAAEVADNKTSPIPVYLYETG